MFIHYSIKYMLRVLYVEDWLSYNVMTLQMVALSFIHISAVDLWLDFTWRSLPLHSLNPDSKDHVGPMNLTIREDMQLNFYWTQPLS